MLTIALHIFLLIFRMTGKGRGDKGKGPGRGRGRGQPPPERSSSSSSSEEEEVEVGCGRAPTVGVRGRRGGTHGDPRDRAAYCLARYNEHSSSQGFMEKRAAASRVIFFNVFMAQFHT